MAIKLWITLNLAAYRVQVYFLKEGWRRGTGMCVLRGFSAGLRWRGRRRRGMKAWMAGVLLLEAAPSPPASCCPCSAAAPQRKPPRPSSPAPPQNTKLPPPSVRFDTKILREDEWQQRRCPIAQCRWSPVCRVGGII